MWLTSRLHLVTPKGENKKYSSVSPKIKYLDVGIPTCFH